MTEHIITREMLVSTLSDVMKERDTNKRLLEQTTQDYSTTLTANKKLRAENEKLASEITTLERSKATLTAEILRLHNELHAQSVKAIDDAAGTTRLAIENDEVDTLHATIRELRAQNDKLHKAHQLASQDLELARANISDHERQIQRLTQKQCQCVPVLEQRLKDMTTDRDQLLSQLPEGMKTCKIVFSECANGHGMLTASNWSQRPCPWCKLNKLLELFEKNIHSTEMLMSNPPKNLVAHRGLEIIGE